MYGALELPMIDAPASFSITTQTTWSHVAGGALTLPHGAPEGGGVVVAFATLKLTPADVPQLPAASAALATIVCCPSATPAEFQLACHGAPLPSDATSIPSTYHLTW